jgi:sarcosine oxidase subunit beta
LHRRQYSALSLVAHGMTKKPWSVAIGGSSLKSSYDCVIVGGGVHGLALAYYLARDHGITRTAVIEKSYVGSGSSGRNTAILRANYLTPEGVRFYSRSLELYSSLSTELNFNILFDPMGHLTLGHDNASCRRLYWRAEVSKLLGIRSEYIGPERVREIVPFINLKGDGIRSILGALWHPPGGMVRHDAVVWGYARAASALGAQIHQHTEVLRILTKGGRVSGVETDRGSIATDLVVNCTAGNASVVSATADLGLPIVTVPLQAAVSEPVRPFLNTVLASDTLHVYFYQTPRGEIVFGSSIDPYPSYSTRGSLEFLENLAASVLELVPSLRNVKILRQWAGICDMTPDGSPIIGATHVDGLLVDVGWGTYGFKAAPAAAKSMASLIATGDVPELIRPFSLDRFAEGRLVNESAASSVGH